MTKTIKLFLILTIICLTAIVGNSISAQEDQGSGDATQEIAADENVTQEIAADENVSIQQLEINDPKILPDNPFYFLKKWARGFRSFLTFNPVKKAELENKFANEKLIELQKMVKNNVSPEKIGKATENYQKQIEKIKTQIDKIKENAENNADVNKFLNKFTKHQILQEKILQKLETQVPAEVFQQIKEARENHLKRFGEIMIKLEKRMPKIKEKIENTLNEMSGSQFKDFKNLEILKNIEEKMPEKEKMIIRQVQGNYLNKLKDKLENMSPEDQNKFRNYIDKISGDKDKKSEILRQIEPMINTIPTMPMFQENLDLIREEVENKIKNRTELRNQIKNCPTIEKPAANFCKNGLIIPQKDDKECLTGFKCVALEELEKPKTRSACTQLWDPVCGKDGKTYSNKCFADLAKIPVIYKGECKKKSDEQLQNRLQSEKNNQEQGDEQQEEIEVE